MEAKTAVALGGSFIGYELADAFAERGLDTTWIMRGPRFLWRVLDEIGGDCRLAGVRFGGRGDP